MHLLASYTGPAQPMVAAILFGSLAVVAILILVLSRVARNRRRP